MDLASLNLPDLKRLLKRVEGEIGRRANATKKDVLKKVHKIVTDAGMSLSELIGDDEKPAKPGRRGKKAGAPRASKKAAAGRKSVGVAKYRNPENAEQTWTGKGRKPLWAQAWLDAGKPLSELEIH